MTKRRAAVRKALDNMRGRQSGEPLKDFDYTPPKPRKKYYGGCQGCEEYAWCIEHRTNVLARFPCEIEEEAT